MSASATCQPESPLLGACASFDFQIQIPRAHAAGFDAAEANALRVLVDMRTPLGAPRAPPQSSSSSRNHKRAKPLLLHVEDLGNENAPAPSLNVDVPVVHVGKAKPALAKQPPVAAMPHERKPASKQASRIQRSSTHAGVSWHKNRNKWLANFTVAGKTVRRFSTFQVVDSRHSPALRGAARAPHAGIVWILC